MIKYAKIYFGFFLLQPHILLRLTPDKRIYNFQIPGTTPTNGLKKLLFQWFVRVLMKFSQIGPTFWIPVKTVIFFGVKIFVTSFILKVRKSHKKSACLDAYLHIWVSFRRTGILVVLCLIFFQAEGYCCKTNGYWRLLLICADQSWLVHG